MEYPNFKKSKKSPDQIDRAMKVKKAVLNGYTVPKPRGPKKAINSMAPRG